MNLESSQEQTSGNPKKSRGHANVGSQEESSAMNVHLLNKFRHRNGGDEYCYFFLNRSGKICDAGFASTRSTDHIHMMWKGHFLGDYVHVEKAAQFHDFLKAVFESDDMKTCEFPFDQTGSRKHLGLKLPLYASVHGVADDTSQHCLIVVEDIGTRMIAERNKAQTLQRLHQQVIETAMDGFWMVDEHGVLEEVNEAYARMSGYSIQELIGMRISELEASEGPEETGAHIDKVLAQGSGRFETRHRRKDGTVIDIEVSATFMPECQRLFMFSRDITRQKPG